MERKTAEGMGGFVLDELNFVNFSIIMAERRIKNG